MAAALLLQGRLQSEISLREPGLQNVTRAMEFFTFLAEKDPASHEAALAGAYGVLARVLQLSGDGEKARGAYRKGIEILQRGFERDPGAGTPSRRHPDPGLREALRRGGETALAGSARPLRGSVAPHGGQGRGREGVRERPAFFIEGWAPPIWITCFNVIGGGTQHFSIATFVQRFIELPCWV